MTSRSLMAAGSRSRAALMSRLILSKRPMAPSLPSEKWFAWCGRPLLRPQAKGAALQAQPWRGSDFPDIVMAIVREEGRSWKLGRWAVDSAWWRGRDGGYQRIASGRTKRRV